MNAVADMFDHGDHMIDYMEFIAALRPDWEERKPEAEQDIIDDEVQRQVMKCTCRQKFRVFQVGEGKYRVSSLVPTFPILLFFSDSCAELEYTDYNCKLD